jgi:cell division protease FtsH
MSLRLASPLIDRAKNSAIIISYALIAEWVDPRPFASSFIAKLLYIALTFEMVRQAWVYFLEISIAHNARSGKIREAWDVQRERIPVNTRFRIRRFLLVLAMLYVYGWVIDGLTDRCTGAPQCAVISVRLLTENIPVILQIAIGMMFGMLQMFMMFYSATKVGSYKMVFPGTIDVTFDDVWGQDKPVARIKEQIILLESSDAVEAAGGYMPKGVLIWGPPGTGKTYVSKAAANASSKPLILVPPGAFASSFVGINFLKVWQLFRAIRKYSMRFDGVIVFIDEIDALGNRGGQVADEAKPLRRLWLDLSAPGWAAMPVETLREHHPWMSLPEPEPQQTFGCVPAIVDDYPVIVGGGSGMNMGTLEAFLSAMDGMEMPRGMLNKMLKMLGFKPLPPPQYRYLMIGATNLPSRLDPALTRAGRFGTKIHMPYPDLKGRIQTFQGYFDKVQHKLSSDEIRSFAADLHRGTGAEIEEIVNEALLVAFRRERDRIAPDDVLNAMLWRQYGEADGRQELAEDERRVAIHEAGHAVAAMALPNLPEYMRLRFGTIEKRGQALGMIAPVDIAERPIRPRQVMLEQIAVSLGSRVAEEMFYHEPTSGQGGDTKHATVRARQMVRAYGMGETLQTFGEGMSGDRFDKDVEKVLREAYQLVDLTLRELGGTIEAVADLLIEKGTVLGSEIQEVYDG